MPMQWDKRRFDGKAKESIFDDTDLYPKKKHKRRLSQKAIKRRREKRKVENSNGKVEKARQKLLMERFAWKD